MKLIKVHGHYLDILKDYLIDFAMRTTPLKEGKNDKKNLISLKGRTWNFSYDDNLL